jgi:predicted nucleic acid-binding protein
MIIDASVAFKWVVEEPGSAQAIEWIGKADLVAPSLIHAEVGNALWKKVRKNEIVDDGEMGERLADLARYLRTIDEAPVIARALRLALDLGHPIYDCIYLAVAEDMDDELLTADRRFLAAVASTDFAPRMRELGL